MLKKVTISCRFWSLLVAFGRFWSLFDSFCFFLFLFVSLSLSPLSCLSHFARARECDCVVMIHHHHHQLEDQGSKLAERRRKEKEIQERLARVHHFSSACL